MRTPIPEITDTQFAFGFRSAAGLLTPMPKPAAPTAWRAVAAHIIEFGLGEKPEIISRPGVELDRALRMLGALLATPQTQDDPETIGRHLATWFLHLRPQGGPLATAR